MTTSAYRLTSATELLIRAQAGESAQTLAEVESALAEPDSHDGNDWAHWLRLVKFFSLVGLSRIAEAGEVAREITRLAEPFNEQVWESHGHALQAMALHLQSRFEPAYDELARAVVLLEETEEISYRAGHAINTVALALLSLDLYELADGFLHRLRSVFRAYDDEQATVESPVVLPMLATLYTYNTVSVQLAWACELDLIGEHDKARRRYQDALHAYAERPRDFALVEASAWPSELGVLAALNHAMLGDYEAVRVQLPHHFAVVAETGRHEAILIAHLALARAHADDDLARALHEAERACAEADLLPRAQAYAVRAYTDYADLLQRRHGETAPLEAYVRLTNRLVHDRWNERRAREQSFEERLAAERVRDEQRRRAAAYLSDSVTGLGNRRMIDIRLPELLVDAEATLRPLTVGFIDLDFFKRINDELSHLVGDDLLRELADQMRIALPSEAVLARFGGDEFVVVLPEHDATRAYAAMDSLRRRVEERIWQTLPTEHRVRMSAGLAESWPGATRTQLLASADEALLSAKRQGKNRVEVRAHPVPHR